MELNDSTPIKILYADDDADEREFFTDATNEISVQTELTTVNDGVELMTTLEEIVIEPPPPHVIFLDLNMPRKNGYECLKEIREKATLKKVPVVVFSTTNSENAVETTYSLGASCYICKPNSYQLLIKAIEAVLALNLWEKNHQLPKEKFVLAIS